MAEQPGGEALTNGRLEWDHGSHTATEDSPWVQIDLGRYINIGAIRIYNRQDGYEAQVLPLVVSGSFDGEKFTEIARTTTLFTQDDPWRIRPTGMGAHYVRFVRITHEGNGYLVLDEVEVFESDRLASLP